MRILESESARLTNYEVYKHSQAMRAHYARNVSGTSYAKPPMQDFLTLAADLHAYFKTFAPACTPAQLQSLGVQLRGKGLTCEEFTMLANLRPTDPAVLDACIDDMDGRFDEDEQALICDVIAEVFQKKKNG